MVAEGTAHIYPRMGPTHEWDTCAAQAIVECGGGKVREGEGERGEGEGDSEGGSGEAEAGCQAQIPYPLTLVT